MPAGGAPGMPAGAMPPRTEESKVNKISRLRYMHVTPQCRHLPIAMRLVVDQSNIHEILAAVANSALRIQVTQVQMQHAGGGATANRNPLPMAGGMVGMFGVAGGPPMAGGPPPMTGGNPGMIPPPAFAGFMLGGRMGGGGGMSPPKGVGPEAGDDVKGGAVKGGTGAKVIDGAQLVEITIYGIATLYERFPPRPGTPQKP